MTRLLILSSSGGAGHVRAGQALEAACRERRPDIEVAHHDVLEFCGRPTRMMVADVYLEIVNRAPGLYRFFYEKSDRELSKRTQALVRKYDRLAYRTLAKRVAEFAPDAIVCTHFLPAHVMVAKRSQVRGPGSKVQSPGLQVQSAKSGVPSPESKVRLTGVRGFLESTGLHKALGRGKGGAGESSGPPGVRPPSISVVLTDYDAHYFWINPGLDRYFVGSDEVRHLLGCRGIPGDRVRVSGIPIHPVFTRSLGREAAARAVGADPRRQTVLVMSGGFGVGHVEETLQRLLAAAPQAQFLVIAGKNESLQRKREAVAGGAAGRVRVFGFVANIQDHMEASDLAVTKAGGLTVTECLARGLPMAVFNPIPGQEEMNADWLVEYGAAVKVKHPDLLGFQLDRLLGDGARLEAMKRAARRLARPDAAFAILKDVLGPSNDK